jgi:hypothetical protein
LIRNPAKARFHDRGVALGYNEIEILAGAARPAVQALRRERR